ncbi:hypothetical protein [Thalassotalea euphylliae]|uniref:hypothetical protein n=1 Tax=Thalassotalea euphylliae TaxID=1655234 RepID=UPI001FE5BE78|nr:hypothetical protein [Thalassotalea euphylliae]
MNMEILKKNIKLLVMPLASFALLGCSALPIETALEDNHFRLENFKRDNTDNFEHVYLMCANQKPASFIHPKQHLSGQHSLWVKAELKRRNIDFSERVAVVNFNVNLEADKSYMLNREVMKDSEKIALWIQETDTGVGVSEVIIADLAHPKANEYFHELKQCRTGSV